MLNCCLQSYHLQSECQGLPAAAFPRVLAELDWKNGENSNWYSDMECGHARRRLNPGHHNTPPVQEWFLNTSWKGKPKIKTRTLKKKKWILITIPTANIKHSPIPSYINMKSHTQRQKVYPIAAVTYSLDNKGSRIGRLCNILMTNFLASSVSSQKGALRLHAFLVIMPH